MAKITYEWFFQPSHHELKQKISKLFQIQTIFQRAM